MPVPIKTNITVIGQYNVDIWFSHKYKDVHFKDIICYISNLYLTVVQIKFHLFHSGLTFDPETLLSWERSTVVMKSGESTFRHPSAAVS